jgi:hypothetical protein
VFDAESRLASRARLIDRLEGALTSTELRLLAAEEKVTALQAEIDQLRAQLAQEVTTDGPGT